MAGPDDLILTIDNGTQSVRAIVFNGRGELLDRVKVELEPYFSEHPGWAEQRGEYYWDQLCAATQQLWAQGVVQPGQITGVAVTTQRGTVVHVDPEGNALRPAITWLDQRRTEGLRPVGGAWGLLFRTVGATPLVRRFQENAEGMWVARNQPEIHARAHKVLLLSGYHVRRLCGRFVDSVAAQVGYLPFDYKRQQWAGPRDWKWGAAGIRREQLPELVPAGGRLGEITEEAARATGIPAGTPLIAAAADKACEVLGSGGLDPDVACLSFGTTATVNTTTTRYHEVVRLVPPWPAAVPDAYNNEIMLYRGFWMVSWFKEQFGLRERQEAAARGVAPESLFDELVRDIPPGSMGLTLQPFWSPGIPEPGPEAKGAVIGFGDVHTRAHLYRAILEGLVYGLRAAKEQIERRSAVRLRRLRIAGGGSRSDVAMQVAADIFGLPAARPHVDEASALGAAIDAAVGLGIHPDFPAAIKAMTRPGVVFEPRAEAQAVYDQLYRRVYLPMYARLRPLYQAIREITGYPE
ncbi:MAG: carbohydrate kinase [Myxococcales bacterium]|nr:FGGY-family carbohydrate kinase [Myxococcales bacterium]MCB9753331.1 carbohydrate kinase [Myxococcales bacterium]